VQYQQYHDLEVEDYHIFTKFDMVSMISRFGLDRYYRMATAERASAAFYLNLMKDS
jgi:hypothetical protein